MPCKEKPPAVCVWKNVMCQCLRSEWNAAARQRSKPLNFRPHVRRHLGFYRPCFSGRIPHHLTKTNWAVINYAAPLKKSDACLAGQLWWFSDFIITFYLKIYFWVLFLYSSLHLRNWAKLVNNFFPSSTCFNFPPFTDGHHADVEHQVLIRAIASSRIPDFLLLNGSICYED